MPTVTTGQEDERDAGLPAGVTLARFRKRVQVDRNDAGDELSNYLHGAASMAAAITKRTLVADQTDDDDPVTIRRRQAGSRFVRVPDLRELVELKLDGVTIDLEDLDVYELRRKPEGLPGPAVKIVIVDRKPSIVEITGRFGWDELPQFLVDAIYSHAGRNYNEKAALFADSVAVGGMDTSSMYNYFRQLPPRVQAAYLQLQVPSDTIGIS